MLRFQKFFSPSMVLFGITLVMLSGFFVSSFLAIVGVTLLFWGAILYYVKPTKQVPFSFVAATSNSSTDNINKFLSAINVVRKGYYLPPKSLHDTNSSLVFIPRHTVHSIPTSELTDNLFASKNDGVLLTPPGYDFSRIMEQRFGQSFSKVDLQILRIQIPKLLVEELEISENVDIQINNDSVIFEIQGNIFINECEQAQKYPLVHETVGCILSSSLACVLAKVTGKAVIIKNEKIVEKTTTIEYQIIEE